MTKSSSSPGLSSQSCIRALLRSSTVSPARLSSEDTWVSLSCGISGYPTTSSFTAMKQDTYSLNVLFKLSSELLGLLCSISAVCGEWGLFLAGKDVLKPQPKHNHKRTASEVEYFIEQGLLLLVMSLFSGINRVLLIVLVERNYSPSESHTFLMK